MASRAEVVAKYQRILAGMKERPAGHGRVDEPLMIALSLSSMNPRGDVTAIESLATDFLDLGADLILAEQERHKPIAEKVFEP